MATPNSVARLSAAPLAAKNSVMPGQTTVPRSGRASLAMRKYQIASLLPDGQANYSDQIGPALPVFESAFSAFARGTLIATSRGQVAVEDLVPGMKILANGRKQMPVQWIGSMSLVPNAEQLSPQSRRLTRVMTDSFGVGRPQSDLMAGPGARLLMRRTGRFEGYSNERVFTPVTNLTDGLNVFDIEPPRPVSVYHIGLPRHAIINAAGLETESFHPGPGFERNMGHNMLTLFLSFFPHIREPRDFGSLSHARIPPSDLPDAIPA